MPLLGIYRRPWAVPEIAAKRQRLQFGRPDRCQRIALVAGRRTHVEPRTSTGRRPSYRWACSRRRELGVARLLLQPSKDNAAIRLAYIHNLGDVWVSLAPVLAGVLLLVTGYLFFDPLIAGGVALWIIVSTGREVFESHEDLIWPEKIVCGHPDHDEPRAVES